jgi:hypothetical protein
MKNAWAPAVEQIVLSAQEQGLRVVGFVSPQQQSGIRELAPMVAETMARAGLPTLLIDLSAGEDWRSSMSRDAQGPACGAPWSPGVRERVQPLIRNQGGADSLKVTTHLDARFRFNNVKALRQALAEEFERYDRIVLMLGDVGVRSGVNPLGPAAACDAVYLLCVPNEIGRSDLGDVVASLKIAGARIGGVVLNDSDQSTPGAEMANWIETRLGFVPAFSSWLARKVRAARLLN